VTPRRFCSPPLQTKGVRFTDFGVAPQVLKDPNNQPSTKRLGLTFVRPTNTSHFFFFLSHFHTRFPDDMFFPPSLFLVIVIEAGGPYSLCRLPFTPPPWGWLFYFSPQPNPFSWFPPSPPTRTFRLLAAFFFRLRLAPPPCPSS